jgi:eukaryotic-like serine/threonine-protein kinase
MCNNLQGIRKRANETQEGLANALGVSTRTIERWEAGQSVPPVPFQQEMARHFDVPVAAFEWQPKPRKPRTAPASRYLLDPALPPLLAPILGRADIPGVLQDHLGRSRLVGLVGLPGSGKTAVLQMLSGTIRAAFDGILWASLGPLSHPQRHWQRWAQLFGLDTLPSDQTSAQEMLRAAIGERRLLILLDEVCQKDDVTPFLLACGDACRFVFTTRQPGLAYLLSESVLRLPDLADADAFALLVADLPPLLVQEYADALHTLVQRVGRLPRALLSLRKQLRQAAYLAPVRYFGEVLERLTSHPVSDDTDLASLEEHLAPVESRAFHLLIQQFREIPFTAQEAAVLHPEHTVLQQLASLTHARLLAWSADHSHFPPALVAYSSLTSQITPSEGRDLEPPECEPASEELQDETQAGDPVAWDGPEHNRLHLWERPFPSPKRKATAGRLTTLALRRWGRASQRRRRASSADLLWCTRSHLRQARIGDHASSRLFSGQQHLFRGKPYVDRNAPNEQLCFSEARPHLRRCTMKYRVGERFGNYRVLDLLGRGGCAEVYLGQHVRVSAQWAAIKILTLPQEDLATFEQEAETVASLVHPHIIRLLDYDVTTKGVPFLVMEYAPGGSLRQRHRDGQPVRLRTVLSYVQQIASALQYAHDRRIVHRDVKPENLLIGEEGSLVLSDFGLAAHGQNRQRAGGTIDYIAPEQMVQRAQPASDQYALAITVYEWLAGERPFTGSFSSLVRKQVRAAPRPLREHRPDLSVEVEEVILRALAKEPEDRWPSVSAMAEALQTASPVSRRVFPTLSVPARRTASAVQVQAPSPPTTQSKRVSRRWVLGAAVTSLGLGGSLWAWSRSGQHPGLTAVSSPTVSALPPTQTAQAPTAPPANDSPQVLIYRGHTQAVLGVTWSPDGRRIASASFDGTVQVWNAATGEPAYVYSGHTRPVNAVAWSPDGTQIASAGNETTVQVWEAKTGMPQLTYWGHFGTVEAIAWSPQGAWIASAGFDQTVQVWEATTGKLLFTYENHTDLVRSVAWEPSGTRIASASFDRTVQVWEAMTGRKVQTYRSQAGPMVTVSWEPSGARMASGDTQRVQVWDVASGSQRWTASQAGVNALSWESSGERIASGDAAGEVVVWRASEGGGLFSLPGHRQSVLAVAFSPSGDRIASAGLDSTVQVSSVGGGSNGQ